MQHNLKYFKTLELNKVLNLLSEEAALPDAAEMAKNLLPQSDIKVVNRLLENTYDAFNLSAETTFPSFGRAKNVSSYLERCTAGGSLNCKEFLELGETLRVIRGLTEWQNNNSAKKANSLQEYFNALIPNKYLEDKIRLIIKSEDEISDNASQELFNIRREIASASANIRNKLDRIVKNPSKSKFLQDAIITQRDGRFVVPVKLEYRSEISGIVHDTSSSGSTLFIEPIAVVEINNDIRVLKSKEKEEIAKILLELSSEVSPFSETIKSSYNSLVLLSLIFAKASLAYKMKAGLPKINNNGYILLKNARHPLINKNSVVPITLELGGEYRSLIITGPNTGGKTVALKTVGLLTLMTMCGLMIPVDDNSCISIFDNILVDIGDEQSIEQSLSTFSSHIVNIIEILNNIDDKSLVLLDELGGGTDPTEGAALAQAIILYIHNRYAKTVATTHYAELKGFALKTEGVENASFEFDVETLKPTYKLCIGIPGRSNAFAIADSLGINKSILRDATSYISNDERKFEDIIENLQKTWQDSVREVEEAKALKEELLKQKSQLDSKLESVNAECERLLKEAKRKAGDLLETTRYKSDLLLNSLENASKELSVENSVRLLAESKSNAKLTISSLENHIDPVEKRIIDNYVLPRSLVIGDSVKVVTLNQNGVVTQLNDGGKKVQVSLGNFKTVVDVNEIQLISNNIQKRKTTRIVPKSLLKAEISQKKAALELDIRGFNCEEGLMELERYIDSSIINGIHNIAVIHGKGTGVLRSAVHSYLKRHSSVKSYRLGTFGEGETGVTIIELK